MRQDEERRALRARVNANYLRAIDLLEDAQTTVARSARIMDAVTRRRDQEHGTTVADLRQLAQQTRAIVEERQELLQQIRALDREAS